MPIGQKTAAIVGQVRNTMLVHHHQVAAVIAENDQHVAVSTELILESRALLAWVDHVLEPHTTSGATSPAAL